MFKKLLCLAALSHTVLECNAYAEFQQTIITTVPAAVAITAINTELAKGTVNPQTGSHPGLYANFELLTNGADANYDYVVTASLQTSDSGNVNAYSQNSGSSYILLGNNTPSLYPSLAAVNNIKGGSPSSAQNPNVIAYPVSTSVSGLSSATFTNNTTYGGLCFIIKTGTSQQGTVSQSISSAPLANTYSFADCAGTYESTVTFSAYRKP